MSKFETANTIAELLRSSAHTLEEQLDILKMVELGLKPSKKASPKGKSSKSDAKRRSSSKKKGSRSKNGDDDEVKEGLNPPPAKPDYLIAAEAKLRKHKRTLRDAKEDNGGEDLPSDDPLVSQLAVLLDAVIAAKQRFRDADA